MPHNNSKKWNAESYSQHSELQYQASKDFLSQYQFKGDEIVLDIGCGHGRLTREIASRVPKGRVIGIDSSCSMIDYAKQNNQETNLEFILMDAQDFSFSSKFDVIMSSFCLQWVKDKKLAFCKIAAHLKEDGAVFAIMPFRHEEIAEFRKYLMQQDKWKLYFENYSDPYQIVSDNLYDIYANQAGLDNIQYECTSVTTRFENADKLTAFLKNINACLTQIPHDNLQKKFMDELVQLYLEKHPPAKDGSCEISYTCAKLRSKGLVHKQINEATDS